MQKRREQAKDINSVDQTQIMTSCENTGIFHNIGKGLYKTCMWSIEIGGIYVAWICIHYSAAHAYVEYCTHKSIYGFIASPILIAAPHCTACRWAINTGATVIGTMWVILGTWISGKLLMRVAKPCTHID
jgi:hypothetical protein